MIIHTILLDPNASRKMYVTILHEAMSTDACDKAGVYFGTGNGQVWFTRDEGKKWQVLADHLPGVMSVEAVVF
jgi:photosystem II stability/assembly factor-like uncharacterized protein